MSTQKEVKIINFRATKFGVFQALELDFEKFKQGEIIAIKGNAGAGKSTIQNGIKTNTQGRNTLADPDQYGDEWEMETTLVDGDRKIFIGAKKKKGKTIDYTLFERDNDGKKVNTPVIDGMKATPSKYMEFIATELTFGIGKFLSKDATTHRKFMFDLFRPELEKLGVVFDKKADSYKNSILGQLDDLTEQRDYLRSQCIHLGAFMSDFQRDGYEKKDLDLLESKNATKIEADLRQLLIDKGQAEGNANADFEKKKGEIVARGQAVTEKIRVLSDEKINAYNVELEKYSKDSNMLANAKNELDSLISSIENTLFLSVSDREAVTKIFTNTYNIFIAKVGKIEEPKKPICPEFVDGKLKTDDLITYEPDFLPLIELKKSIGIEYMELEPETVNLLKFEEKETALKGDLAVVQANNKLVERYDINRQWVEADALVNQKRHELAKLYAQVSTGVDGLYMKPFFNEDGKMEIKTVYTGDYDPEFFKNRASIYLRQLKDIEEGVKLFKCEEEKEIKIKELTDTIDERLLISYSSTQMPIIGILLQVARLKTKSKALKYIFLDDVPMDIKSRNVITKIAQENGLNIITSLTGDFDKEKLTENELLVENGHVFFNEKN